MNKTEIISLISIFSAFLIIVVASGNLSKFFKKIKLPAITGFIIIGVMSGPYLLKMLPGDLNKLQFINDISLAFIAFASGVEIYLKEIKDKLKDISIMTAAQFFITFIISFILIMILADYIPFMQNVGKEVKIAISLLVSTIFIARSPASAIAIINELRAKGSFTKVALGVTIVKDIFVLILFSITFSIADVLITGKSFDIIEILIVVVDLFLSILFGYIYSKIIILNFKINKSENFDIFIILLLGWSMFALSHMVSFYSILYLHHSIHLEALLIGIIASFFVTNYSQYRIYLAKIIQKVGPFIYATFFTLIGASISIDILLKYWGIAFLLFGIRIVALFIASITGSIILKKTVKSTLLSWTPYITQAGVSLGLITIISAHFLNFGVEFEAILIAVIIINQFIGPPLMKWAIISVGESHVKSNQYHYDMQKDIFIFGIGGKAILLAKSLIEHGNNVKIISDRQNIDTSTCKNIPIANVEKITYEVLEKENFKSADTVVIFRTEDAALEICELIYEKYGTPHVLVVLEVYSPAEKLKELGAIVFAQTSAFVTLLSDFVRSPKATQILLGLEQSYKTQDVEVLAKDVHGHSLRDLQFPLGLLVLSISRNGEVILPHGYTRLRLNDIVTVVGSENQLDLLRTKLQYN